MTVLFEELGKNGLSKISPLAVTTIEVLPYFCCQYSVNKISMTRKYQGQEDI